LCIKLQLEYYTKTVTQLFFKVFNFNSYLSI